jgi:hypothetical protein
MLKNDLLNEIKNDKYFAEMELNRLAQSIDIPYREKIAYMSKVLSEIDSANKKMDLVRVYFGDEPVQRTANMPAPAPAPEVENPQPVAPRKPIEGQSHGE